MAAMAGDGAAANAAARALLETGQGLAIGRNAAQDQVTAQTVYKLLANDTAERAALLQELLSFQLQSPLQCAPDSEKTPSDTRPMAPGLPVFHSVLAAALLAAIESAEPDPGSGGRKVATCTNGGSCVYLMARWIASQFVAQESAALSAIKAVIDIHLNGGLASHHGAGCAAVLVKVVCQLDALGLAGVAQAVHAMLVSEVTAASVHAQVAVLGSAVLRVVCSADEQVGPRLSGTSLAPVMEQRATVAVWHQRLALLLDATLVAGRGAPSALPPSAEVMDLANSLLAWMCCNLGTAPPETLRAAACYAAHAQLTGYAELRNRLVQLLVAAPAGSGSLRGRVTLHEMPTDAARRPLSAALSPALAALLFEGSVNQEDLTGHAIGGGTGTGSPLASIDGWPFSERYSFYSAVAASLRSQPACGRLWRDSVAAPALDLLASSLTRLRRILDDTQHGAAPLDLAVCFELGCFSNWQAWSPPALAAARQPRPACAAGGGAHGHAAPRGPAEATRAAKCVVWDCG
jgi:hypothetical protein